MRKLVTVLLTAVLAFIPSLVKADTAPIQRDWTLPAVYGLDRCLSSVELDCIESVELVNSNGASQLATFESTQQISSRSQQNGNQIFPGITIWSVGGRTIKLEVQLESPNHVIWKRTDGSLQTGAALRGNFTVDRPLETLLRTKIRTSWLRPMNVQLKMKEADFSQNSISGGNLWTIEGKATSISNYVGDWLNDPLKKNYSAKADSDDTEFSFIIHHAGVDSNSSYWPPVCADKGYTVQSHNTNATGDPNWNSKEEYLEFSIFSPHLKADGMLNEGYFRFWTTHSFMDCKFPTNTLTKASKLVLEIINEDGSQSIATTSIKNTNGKLFFSAAGFHFSTPKIILKKVEEPTPTPSPLASTGTTSSPSQSNSNSPIVNVTPGATKTPEKKVAAITKKTITCVKGKLIKRVTAVNPKCPTGYAKK